MRKKVEIDEKHLRDLERESLELSKLRKRFDALSKGEQKILCELERYEKALKILTWEYGCVSPESMRMRSVAKKALYDEE